MKRLCSAGFIALMAMLLSVSMAWAATLTVNKPGGGGVPPDYTTIEAAIAAAGATGDTIMVYPGDYNLPVGNGYLVDKSVIIKSQKGANATKIIATADGYGFRVIADNVTISGFTIKPAVGVVIGFFRPGILVGGTSFADPVATALTGVVITKCIVEYFSNGIMILKANGTNVNNNTTRYNTDYAIFLYSRDFAPPNPGFSDYDILNTEISHNQIYENQYYGIGLMDANGYGASFNGTVVTTNTFYRNGSQDYTAPANWNQMGIYIGINGAVGTITINNNKFLRLSDEVSFGYFDNNAGAGVTLVQSGNKAFKKLKGTLTGGATTID